MSAPAPSAADEAPTERIDPIVAPAPAPPGSDAPSPGDATPTPPPSPLGPATPAPTADTPSPGDATPTTPPSPLGPAAPAPADATQPASGVASDQPPAQGDTTPGDPAAEQATVAAEPVPRRPGFRERGRMRRRLRYLRRLRELQVRDLGGLVFDLRRFERKRDDLVAQKIDHIRACDDELRALEEALNERRPLRDVREPGIGGTCPRCFAIYGSVDRFCSNCGVALGGAVQGPAQVAPARPEASDG